MTDAKRRDENTRSQLERWLSDHLTPSRTASGSVAKSRGLTQYEEMGIFRVMLGAPITGPVEEFRAGNDVPYHVRKAIEEIVEVWDMGAILILRRDQDLVRELRSGINFHDRHGTAPDGGDLPRWAARAVERINGIYGVKAAPTGDAKELLDVSKSKSVEK